MKKTYMKPTVTVNKVMVESLMANSVASVGGDAGIGLGTGAGPGTADGKIRGSRTTDNFDDLW